MGLNNRIITEVCHNVNVEPPLLPLNEELITPSSASYNLIIMQELTPMQEASGAGNKVYCSIVISILTHQVIVRELSL